VSQENVEIVRETFAAFETGGIAGMAEYWHPEINWRAIEGAPDDIGEMVGITAVERYFQEWLDMFEDVTNVAEELIAVGDNRAVAVQLASGRAKISGVDAQLRYAVAYAISDGKIIRAREYATREEALKAAGLEAE
jgi:ketosteroid isomerase-like protein